MNAIAHQMGTSGPAMYRYFGSRDDLVEALASAAQTSLCEYLEVLRQEHHGDNPPERLKVLLLAYRRWAITHSGEYCLLFGRSTLLQAGNPENLLKPLLIVLGEMDLSDPQRADTFWTTWAHLHGWVSLELSGRLPPGLDDIENKYSQEIVDFLAVI